MRILVLGVNGMLGSTLFGELNRATDLDVYGTLRRGAAADGSPALADDRLLTGIDACDQGSLVAAVCRVRPDIVINCIGLVKQRAEANDPLSAIPVNALLPHHLARLCALHGARLVHISTDCVFSGRKGLYREADSADAEDLYGRSKYLGEVHDDHCITLRTSIIGHESGRSQGLIDWFLAQQGVCRGYVRAVFSGLPTVVLARVIRDIIIRRADLHGLYHIAAAPISKYALLRLVADVYDKPIELIADDTLVVDRSLNADHFRAATGYVPPGWPDLVRIMHAHYLEITNYDDVQR